MAAWGKLSDQEKIAVGRYANVSGIDTGGAYFSTWLANRGWEYSEPPLVGFTDPKVLQESAKDMERLRQFMDADERHRAAIGAAVGQWQPILRKLGEQIGRDQIASWFGSVSLRSISDSEIVVVASSAFHRREVETRFADALVRAARAADPDCTVTCARVVLGDTMREAAH